MARSVEGGEVAGVKEYAEAKPPIHKPETVCVPLNLDKLAEALSDAFSLDDLARLIAILMKARNAE